MTETQREGILNENYCKYCDNYLDDKGDVKCNTKQHGKVIPAVDWIYNWALEWKDGNRKYPFGKDWDELPYWIPHLLQRGYLILMEAIEDR